MQEKIEERTNLGPFLLNLCHSYRVKIKFSSCSGYSYSQKEVKNRPMVRGTGSCEMLERGTRMYKLHNYAIMALEAQLCSGLNLTYIA